MMFKSGTLLAPEDRAEIAASEAAQYSRRRTGGDSNYALTMSSGCGGDEAFASPEDDVQDTAALGE
jgi:hypothetical protein